MYAPSSNGRQGDYGLDVQDDRRLPPEPPHDYAYPPPGHGHDHGHGHPQQHYSHDPRDRDRSNGGYGPTPGRYDSGYPAHGYGSHSDRDYRRPPHRGDYNNYDHGHRERQRRDPPRDRYLRGDVPSQRGHFSGRQWDRRSAPSSHFREERLGNGHRRDVGRPREKKRARERSPAPSRRQGTGPTIHPCKLSLNLGGKDGTKVDVGIFFNELSTATQRKPTIVRNLALAKKLLQLESPESDGGTIQLRVNGREEILYDKNEAHDDGAIKHNPVAVIDIASGGAGACLGLIPMGDEKNKELFAEACENNYLNNLVWASPLDDAHTLYLVSFPNMGPKLDENSGMYGWVVKKKCAPHRIAKCLEYRKLTLAFPALSFITYTLSSSKDRQSLDKFKVINHFHSGDQSNNHYFAYINKPGTGGEGDADQAFLVNAFLEHKRQQYREDLLAPPVLEGDNMHEVIPLTAPLTVAISSADELRSVRHVGDYVQEVHRSVFGFINDVYMDYVKAIVRNEAAFGRFAGETAISWMESFVEDAREQFLSNNHEVGPSSALGGVVVKQEPGTEQVPPPPLDPVLQSLLAICETLPEEGRLAMIEFARVQAGSNPQMPADLPLVITNDAAPVPGNQMIAAQPREIVLTNQEQPIVEEPEAIDQMVPFLTEAQTEEEVERELPQLFPRGSAIRDPRFMNWDVVHCGISDESEQILLRVRQFSNPSCGSNCFTNKSRLEEIFQNNPVCDFSTVSTFNENQNCQYNFYCIQKISDIIVGVGVGTKKKYAMQAASKSTLWRLGFNTLEITTT